jgi:hypothetical protein
MHRGDIRMRKQRVVAVLFLALLTIPAAVAAATSTTFTGTIPSGTTISVNPTTIPLGTIQVPHTYDGLSVTVTVTTGDSVNWNLQAQDTTSGSTARGFMYSATPVARNLTSPFKIWDYTLTTPVYQPLGPGVYTWYNGHGTGTTTVNALFRQEVTTNDLAGSYSTVVTFTWVAAA